MKKLSLADVLPALALLLAALFLLASAPAGADSPDSARYRIADREVALVRVPEIASVGLRGGVVPAKLAGGQVAALSRHAVGATWQVDLLPALDPSPKSLDDPAKQSRAWRRRELLDDALDALRAAAGVDWAYPAYRSVETGTLLLPTPYLVISVAPGIDRERLERALVELEVDRPLRLAEGQWRVRLADPGQDPLALALSLTERFSWIAWAEPDFVWQIQYAALPNDPLVASSWHLANTGQGGGKPGADARLSAAWGLTRGNGSVVIAVIDDGVQWSHPDLASRIFANSGEVLNGVDDDHNGYVDDVRGWDFSQGDNDPDPDLSGPGSHGTAVAGVAAAAGNNAVGGSGACQNCRILPVRISDDAGFVDSSTIAEAIRYAARYADVLNNSWGGGSPEQVILDAIDFARTQGRGGKGAPTLFADGNSASGYLSFAIGFEGVPAGNYTFEWAYVKDESANAGLDRAWIDNVVLPDGSLETFEGCHALPAGWSTGPYAWAAVNDETRASSKRGGGCSIGSAIPPANEASFVDVTRYITGAPGSQVKYDAWASSERQNGNGDGTGPLVVDDCYDYLGFWFKDPDGSIFGPIFPLCGTYSNQGNPLRDGVLSFPASDPDTISVGAATNFDRRSDYAQWGLDMNGQPGIDFVAHSSGGSVQIVATDVTGANGYDPSDYTSTFGGTSSATPLASGIVGLLLTQEPDLTYDQVRARLRQATRKIGGVPYVAGANLEYGYGALDAYALLSAAPPPPPVNPVLFLDNFESGNLSKWSAKTP